MIRPGDNVSLISNLGKSFEVSGIRSTPDGMMVTISITAYGEIWVAMVRADKLVKNEKT